MSELSTVRIKERKTDARILRLELQGRRFRAQSLSTSQLTDGWIEDVLDRRITVKLNPGKEIRIGDLYHFESEGATRKFMFTCMIEEIADEVGWARLTSEVTSVTLPAESRVTVADTAGFTQLYGFPVALRVTNGTSIGAGFQIEAPVETDAILDMELTSPHGYISMRVSVRHCRKDPKFEGMFLAGGLIVEINRISRARWILALSGG